MRARPSSIAIAASVLAVVFTDRAFAEDTAAVLAAMPDQPASQRYLDDLCHRIGAAEDAEVVALQHEMVCAHNPGACPERDGVGGAVLATQATKVTATTYATRRDEYGRGADVFRAKYNAAPVTCEFADDRSTNRIAEKQRELVAAQNEPHTSGAARADCEQACRDLAAGDACLANCARYK